MKKTEYVILSKENFAGFIARLSKIKKVVAPVSKGFNSFAFEDVATADNIALNYIPTILPPKKYFMPQKETLLEFNMSKGLSFRPVVEYENMVIFGVHTCDLAGIQCLNTVFSIRPRDYNYLLRKRKIEIIGFECNSYCDEYASCSLVNSHLPSGGYDLFFTDLIEYFIVHVNTQLGDNIVEAIKYFEPAEESHLNALTKLRKEKRTIFKNETIVETRQIAELFNHSFNSSVWADLDKRCLSCGSCTNVCPTCYCFDIREDVDLVLKSGIRYRAWDSCQLEPFAKVAGGENFRKTRLARQRHRFYRKFSYQVSKFSRFFCTGCGRCSRACIAKINLKETLNALYREIKVKV